MQYYSTKGKAKLKVAFYYEYGKIPEIGTGHHFRCKTIASELKKRGHKIVDHGSEDLLIVDHIFSQKQLLLDTKSKGIKTVLIDGSEDDVDLADLSISPIYNKKSQNTGLKYVVLPLLRGIQKYSPRTKSDIIFVSMGGFDYSNYADMIVDVLIKTNRKAIITKSINHGNLKNKYNNIEIFDEEDYYLAMKECVVAITGGGLTLFQCLYYGIPTIPIPQYEHQKSNIEYVNQCCVLAKTTREDIEEKLEWLIAGENYRESLSVLSQHFVRGDGCFQVCNLIEKTFV